MPVRSTMEEIIAKVRGMINDPANGAKQVFTDLEVQDQLDTTRTHVRYLPLEPLEEYGSGTIVYMQYSTKGNMYPWEQDAVIVNGVYETITPASVDWLQGIWTLSTSTLPPVMAIGKVYDMNMAAALLCEDWAATKMLKFGFGADDQKFQREQMHEMLTRQARTFRKRARPQRAVMNRSDT